MSDYATLSGGEGSWRAAKIWRAMHPGEPLNLVFTDVLLEDADAYRFLLEGAANILGRTLDWIPQAEDFPDYRAPADTPIEEYAGNPEWRAYLAALRARAAIDLPELVWLVEGRDPWEVFRDERFIGNSRKDPCSKILKRQMLDRWRKANCDPVTDRFLVGIGWDERHRFEGRGKSLGLRRRMEANGWDYRAPLIDVEAAINAGGVEYIGLLVAPLEEFGVASPRLYGLGYMHNNCGGFCVKAGFPHWQNRRRVQPERFAYDAMMERKLIADIGASAWPMLTDRRGDGKKKKLTLDAFAERLDKSPEVNFEYSPGSSGCGCAIDDSEDEVEIAA